MVAEMRISMYKHNRLVIRVSPATADIRPFFNILLAFRPRGQSDDSLYLTNIVVKALYRMCS